MQSHEMQKAAPTEDAIVDDPRVSAFLTGMAAIYEEIEQIQELFFRLVERVQRVSSLEEPPIEVWTSERNAEVQAELEAEMRYITVLLASASASAAELGSLNPRTSEKSTSEDEYEKEQEEFDPPVLPNSIAAALHFFNKTRCRIRRITACHHSLVALIPTIKARGEMMDTSFRGKSGEEIQEVIKQMKLILLLLQHPYGQPEPCPARVTASATLHRPRASKAPLPPSFAFYAFALCPPYCARVCPLART